MGMESFGVFYTCEQSPDVGVIKSDLKSFGVLQWSNRNQDCFEGVFSTDIPIEIQLCQLDTIVSKLAFRFAVVNPPGAIDQKFFDVVNWSLQRWPGEVNLMSSFEMETPFSGTEWEFKQTDVLREITLHRERWFSICGGDYMVSPVGKAVSEMLKRIRARNQ